MKIVIAPDKFKGSLTSRKVCKNLAEGLQMVNPRVQIISLPMADGGDGFASVLKEYHHTETIACASADPLGRAINVSYEWNAATRTAIVELAVSSGLVLLSPGERNPLKTSTYGTGLVIKDAISRGAEKVLLGLGGSATNDAGMGILQALGFDFLDEHGKKLQASGENLMHVFSILKPALLPAIEFAIACDVTNSLYGSNGAAAVYAPQKGADAAAVTLLDAALENFNNVLRKLSGSDNSNVPGAGAAGGIAVGLMAYFPVELKQGIDIVARAAGLESAMKNADFILTGEGQLDGQSSKGKVVGYVNDLAAKHDIPVVVFAGMIDLDSASLARMGFEAAFAISKRVTFLQDSMQNAGTLLQEAAKDWLSRLGKQVGQ